MKYIFSLTKTEFIFKIIPRTSLGLLAICIIFSCGDAKKTAIEQVVLGKSDSAVPAKERNMQQDFVSICSSINSSNIRNYINEESGAWIIDSPGAMPAMKQVNEFPQEVKVEFASLQEGELPKIDCSSKTLWTKIGCFTQEVNTFKDEKIWKYCGLNKKDEGKAEQLAQALKDKTMELRMQLNSLKERLSVEFNLDLNEILDKEPSPDWTEDELKEKVARQKSQLDNYGPINPMAVEAFNEIKERHTFIIAQKDDLAKAKESLLQTISEIELTAKDNFLTAFTAIRTNFIKVFRSLFTEDDDCDLILLDPSNPTESDVQIIAKPKGKRPLSISQLSGGEKTLTAIALLFGIYLLKPAPFCIFDEVDAPLDDSNIDKWNNIIRKFSKESQFIIITHNKRTMSATEVIYGITMAEPGVTQVVAVDFTEMVE